MPVECKRHRNPIKRDVVVLPDAKLRDSGAQKGIIFSTSAFQSGALKYVEARGIATFTVRCGKTDYHTRSIVQNAEPLPWVLVSKFIAWFTTLGATGHEQFNLVDDTRIGPLAGWFRGRGSVAP